MGRVWSLFAGAALCLACGGKSANPQEATGGSDPGGSTSTGGSISTGGSTAACSDDDGPLCASDGVIYPSSCAIYAAGAEIDESGQCQLEGSFFCRARPCQLSSEACVTLLNHAGGSISPACIPISEECRAAVVSGDDKFCECVRPGRCQCQHQDVSGETAISKQCGDR